MLLNAPSAQDQPHILRDSPGISCPPAARRQESLQQQHMQQQTISRQKFKLHALNFFQTGRYGLVDRLGRVRRVPERHRTRHV